MWNKVRISDDPREFEISVLSDDEEIQAAFDAMADWMSEQEQQERWHQLVSLYK